MKDKLDIIYEDKNIIVINKIHNLLTVGTEKEKEKTLYHKVSEYVKKQHKSNKIFIVHRLDKETSGIVLFAKNEQVKKLFQDNWDSLVKYRGYVAVVHGNVQNESDILISYLKDNSMHITYVTDEHNKYAKKAITKYKILDKNKLYSLLDIFIETGRKNQIRVQLNEIDHGIIGDKKYGTKNDPLKRLALHAYKLIIYNPILKKEMIFETKIPIPFLNLFKKDKSL